MSGEFAISSTQPRQSVAAPPAAPAAANTAPAQLDSTAPASKRPLLNPSLHLDLALNLVVLQFIDDKGDVTNSIPSVQQIKAYKAHEAEASKPPAGK